MKKRTLLSAFLVLVSGLGLTACSSSTPSGQTSKSSSANTIPVKQVSVMATIGDSITQGTDSCGFSETCPANSWAIGTDVDSHAALIEKATGKPVTVYNDAVVGAKSSDLSAQVQTVISQTPDYVTFLIGGNDFCAASRTDPVTFNNNISQALATLSSALPDTKIFVSSLPNPITLWSVNHENAQAQQTWAYANICPSLFSNPTDVSAAGNTRRQAVYDEAVSYNSILQLNCAKYINCHFDNNTVFNIKFSADEISNSDFFHPSKKGQELLAEKTWTDGGVKTFLLG